MKRSRLVFAVLALLAVPALAAQLALAQPVAPPPDTVPLQQFLERRVIEELAAEGTVLGRLGYSVRIQIAGNVADISLFDITSQRVVRSTKVEALAADREAALATVTQVVANLVAQQSQLGAPSVEVPPATLPPGAAPAAPAPAPPPPPPPKDTPEAAFAREALGIGDPSIPAPKRPNPTEDQAQRWRPWQGSQRRITYSQFYRIIDRSDLEKARTARRQNGGFLLGVAGAGFLTANIVAAFSLVEDIDPKTLESTGPNTTGLIAAVGITLASVACLVGGIHYMTSQPITQAEARKLAQKHNDDLRRKYGLPVVSSSRTLRPNLRLTAVAPYVAESQAGLAVRMSF